MIPKVIHQTWKNAEVPSEWMNYVNKVKTLNPEWTYRLWTDDTMIKFVEDEFPDFLETYIAYPKNVMRADAFRYLIMYKLGGVYLDLDYEVLKSFDFKDYNVVLPYNRQIKIGDTFDGIGNCFFASEPGHPFWYDVIQYLKNGEHQNPVIKRRHSTLEEESTGPAFLTRAYNSKSYAGVFCPDRMVYHPPTPKKKTEKKKIENNGISLGVHHCAGSWREKRLKRVLKSCKNALKRILR